nr:RNA-binding protein [Leucobacter chinensis]
MSAVQTDAVLEHLIQGIVDHPADVKISTRETARGDILEVRVNPEDLGRVIGRSGRTAQSLRTVVGALVQDRRVRIDVVDTDNEDSVG